MALLDFLKNKKEAEKAKSKKTPKALVELKTENAEKEVEKVKAVSVNKNAGKFSYNVVKEPHISEKATILAENSKYTFKVYGNTNKPEIKKSVEGIYGVNVLRVNIMKAPKKKRRVGRTEGYK